MSFTLAVWWLSAVASAGGLRVVDAAGCLDREAFDLEVRQLLTDAVVSELGVVIAVSEADDALLSVNVDVSEDGTALWTRGLRVEQADCPFLAPLLARSVEQGLKAIPGWDVGVARRRAPREAAMQVVGSGPQVFRGDFGATLGVGLVGPVQLVSEAFVLFTGVQDVAAGVGQLFGPLVVAAGPGVWIPLDDHAMRASVTFGLGPVLAFGNGFLNGDTRQWFLRHSVRPAVVWVLPVDALPLRLGITGEVVTNRAVYVDEFSGQRVREPPGSVGLLLGLGGIIRKR